MTLEKPKSPNDFADFWRNQIGVNVIPAVTKTKIPKVKWAEWQDKPIPQELHDEWKSKNMFDDGLAVICGQVFHNAEHKGKWLNGTDLDNQKGIDVLCTQGIKKAAAHTLIEQHSNKAKGHIYFYTKDRPIKGKTANDGKNGTVPQIEIKSGGKALLYCSGGVHEDGSSIEIVGTDKVRTIDATGYEERIDSICKEYDIPYLTGGVPNNMKPVDDMIKDDFVLHEGENRSQAILRLMDSKKKLNPEFGEIALFGIGMGFNQKHCKPSYDETKIRALAKQANEFIEKKIQEEQQYQIEHEVIVSLKKTETKDVVDSMSEKVQKIYTFKTMRDNEETLIYTGKIYESAEAEARIKEFCEKNVDGCNTALVNEVINKVKRQTGENRDSFDDNENKITSENYVINIKTLEKEDHSPNNLSQVLIPCNFIEDPKYHVDAEYAIEDIERILDGSLFLKYLTECFTVNNRFDFEQFYTVLESMALCILKTSKIEKAIMFTGVGSNGKSVLLDFLNRGILGHKNVSNVTIQSLATNRFSSAELYNKMANIYPDIESHELSSTGIIKALISGDRITAEKKHQAPFSFNNNATLVFSANRFPTVKDNTDAFFRRFVIVDWKRQFTGKEIDVHLKTKLSESQEEKDQVFNLLLRIAQKINRRGRFLYQKRIDEIRKQWNKHSDPVALFVDTMIEDADGEHERKPIVYKAYRVFCSDNEIQPLTIVAFGRAFGEYCETDQRKTGSVNRKVWVDIRIKKPTQTVLMKERDN